MENFIEDPDNPFAIFDYEKELRTVSVLDAEFRCCLFRILEAWFATPPTWAEIQKIYKEIALENERTVCNHFGSYLVLKPDEYFRDPATGENFGATGTVVVCRTCMRQHICRPDEPCAFNTSNDANQTQCCAMTGTCKNAIIVSCHKNAPKHIVQAILANVVSEARSSKGTKRSSSAKPAARKTSQQKPCPSTAYEIEQLIAVVFTNGGLARAAVAGLQTAYTKFTNELRRLPRRNFFTVCGLCTDILVPSLNVVLSLLPFLIAGGRLQKEQTTYLTTCITEIVAFLRGTPMQKDGNNARSAQGIRANKLFGEILHALAHGLIGRIVKDESSCNQYEIGTNKQIEKKRVLDNVAVVRVLPFIPEHQFLKAVVPQMLMPAGQEHERVVSLFGNSINNTMNLSICYMSAMCETNDPEAFCLGKSVQLNESLGIQFAAVKI
jgi:hypothetical protein